MNPYPERIRELHDCLSGMFSQHDHQSADIILACHLHPDVTLAKRPWLILETDYPARDTFDAWFAFGGEIAARSLVTPRLMRLDPCDRLMGSWIDNRHDPAEPGLFVEPEWRKPTVHGGVKKYIWSHFYAILMAQCVRLRVAHPRSDQGMRIDRTADKLELARLARRVLDSDHRDPSLARQIAASAAPASFLYWCELLQRLAPWQTDWEALTGALAGIARGVAILYGDGRPADWEAAERVMRDCVNHFTVQIVELLSFDKVFSRTGATYWDLFRRVIGAHEQKQVEREMERLTLHGVVNHRRAWKPGIRAQRWGMGNSDWVDLVRRDKRILK